MARKPPDPDFPIWLVEADAAGAVLAARHLGLMATAWNLWDGKELAVNA
jgi:hypothetical protein